MQIGRELKEKRRSRNGIRKRSEDWFRLAKVFVAGSRGLESRIALKLRSCENTSEKHCFRKQSK
jgi:hypothetical protein